MNTRTKLRRFRGIKTLARVCNLEATTTDGHHVELFGNISGKAKIYILWALKVSACTSSFIWENDELPAEDVQFGRI